MVSGFVQPRLPPLPSTFERFQDLRGASRSHRRRHSFGGYVPFCLANLHDAQASAISFGVTDVKTEETVAGIHSGCLSNSDGAADNESFIFWPDTDDEDFFAHSSQRQEFYRQESTQGFTASALSMPSYTMIAASLSSVPSVQLLEPSVGANLAPSVAGSNALEFVRQESSVSGSGESSEATIQSDSTTVMIRNLPPRLTQQRLLEEMDKTGFAGRYDFCYMPCSFTTYEGKGFAFANFTTSALANDFINAWHGKQQVDAMQADPALNISFAALQGFQANIAKWDTARMRRIKNPKLKPFVARRD